MWAEHGVRGPGSGRGWAGYKGWEETEGKSIKIRHCIVTGLNQEGGESVERGVHSLNNVVI